MPLLSEGPKMIYTLTGANSFLLKTQVRQLITDFVKQYGDFGLERLNAEEADYAKLLESVQAMPFLAAKRMVVIDAPASNKELVEKIEILLDTVNDQTDIVFVEPKFDKRSSLYKLLKKKTDFSEFNELDEGNLSSWIVGQTKAQGGEISRADARYLVQRIGINQLRLSNELAKLLTYNSVVTRKTIDLLTVQTPQSTIFDLLDAAFAGNKKKALQLYQEQRRQKVEPQAILALVAWQLYNLSIVKAAGDRTIEQVAKEAKLNPFVVRKTANLARNISLSDLKLLVSQTLSLDLRLKSETMDADEALQDLLISI